jgi:hypothetical protein
LPLKIKCQPACFPNSASGEGGNQSLRVFLGSSLQEGADLVEGGLVRVSQDMLQGKQSNNGQ